jgi:hypothetical protein
VAEGGNRKWEEVFAVKKLLTEKVRSVTVKMSNKSIRNLGVGAHKN